MYRKRRLDGEYDYYASRKAYEATKIRTNYWCLTDLDGEQYYYGMKEDKWPDNKGNRRAIKWLEERGVIKPGFVIDKEKWEHYERVLERYWGLD